MRARLLLAGVVLAVLPWVLEPAGTPAASLSGIQQKIQTTQGLIGRKKGTERVLTTQISAYSRRIGRLQGRITTLTVRQTRLQADLDAKRRGSSARRRSSAPSVRGWSGCARG